MLKFLKEFVYYLRHVHIYIMKIDKELVLNYYAMGHELSQDEQNFPDWFEFEYEKQACLLGFTDYDLGITRENEEIIEIVKNKVYG